MEHRVFGQHATSHMPTSRLAYVICSQYSSSLTHVVQLIPAEAFGFTPESAQSVSPLALPAGLAAASSLVRDEPVPFDSLLDTPVPIDFQEHAGQSVIPHSEAVSRPPPLPGPVPRENPELKKLNDELNKAKEEVRDLKSRLKITKSLLVRNNDAQHTNIPSAPAVASAPSPFHPFPLDAASVPRRDEIDALDGETARAALRVSLLVQGH